ncbi:MBL fold metallo-hydrolase [Paenibacillus sp. CAA11]|uniref:MBL fold metallo-hydrolase n=1 Tax=Paenibacillus sp. CAA11 TaxID=1532905 RepID=UPI001F31C875|nr:MBL fold metallo-hydrolase [Paenibacillus sp. CAA11]
MNTAIVVTLILAALWGVGYAAMVLYPPFGGKPDQERMEQAAKSLPYIDGKFTNPMPPPEASGFGSSMLLLWDFIKRDPLRRPQGQLQVRTWAPLAYSERERTAITWLGHSASILEMDGKLLLLDPMLGRYPSSIPFIGGKRYGGLPVAPEEMPLIDLVLMSHDHYDHLDYRTIRKLKDKVGCFLVPLGVGAHLQRWGIDSSQIEELDWWEESEYDGLKLACTPARHSSGRRLRDRDTTLWCSWAIQGESRRIFFSGDSGYDKHFAEIGRKYGPFDAALMECGQYDRRWSAVHMTPEQTIQAHLDVRGGLLLPVHWAAFTLALHPWTEPVERAIQAAKQKGVTITTPEIGEKVILGEAPYPVSAWWRQ